MKKGKIAITITIGIMCLILTMIIFIQINTVKKTNISELERLNKKDLETEIRTLETKTEEIATKLVDVNDKIKEYDDAMKVGAEASELLGSELKEREDLLGKTEVTGQGIIITLTSGEKQVTVQDLLDLVNQLKNAGAEAISINDKRIVYESYIVNINGDINSVSVNGNKTGEPFIVKAIGNVSHLESGVAQKKYGYIDTKISEGRNVTLEKYDSIVIEAYNRKLDFEYVKEEE